MPEKRLWDYDRTLFDTDKFANVVWEFIAERYGEEAAKERANATDFFTYSNNQYDYDFFSHMKRIGIAGDDLEMFMADLRAQHSGQFLFDDVSDEMLASAHAILTFGNAPFQEFKLSMEPRVAGIMKLIVQEPKGPYIAKTFGDEPTVLIDDKDIGAEILPPSRFVRLNRAQVEPIVVVAGHVAISSLTYLDHALELNIDKT